MEQWEAEGNPPYCKRPVFRGKSLYFLWGIRRSILGTPFPLGDRMKKSLLFLLLIFPYHREPPSVEEFLIALTHLNLTEGWDSSDGNSNSWWHAEVEAERIDEYTWKLTGTLTDGKWYQPQLWHDPFEITYHCEDGKWIADGFYFPNYGVPVNRSRFQKFYISLYYKKPFQLRRWLE